MALLLDIISNGCPLRPDRSAQSQTLTILLVYLVKKQIATKPLQERIIVSRSSVGFLNKMSAIDSIADFVGWLFVPAKDSVKDL